MGKRCDAIAIHRGVIMVIEFKVGGEAYDSGALDQVLDYALDLKNFHSGSHDWPIVPILVSTGAKKRTATLKLGDQKVYDPLLANAETFGEALFVAASVSTDKVIDPKAWACSPYSPTPTIVEAAQALYDQHSVADISRSDAGAINLTRTAGRVSKIIKEAKRTKRKTLCLITGVPGSGKTLAGLNIAIQHAESHKDDNAVYLSGNGPLVSVLREALARNDVTRQKDRGQRIRKSDALRRASTFIQNIHHFRDEGLRSEAAPVEKIVVFDEAQRAWDREQTSSFMRRKRAMPDLNQSEPDYLLSLMDRHADWRAVICLVGGGQEINTGEAGIGEWVETLRTTLQHWDIHFSDKVDSPEYSWAGDLSTILEGLNSHNEPDLHLAVSLRSYRAESLSSYVSALINADAVSARNRLQGAFDASSPRDGYFCASRGRARSDP